MCSWDNKEKLENSPYKENFCDLAMHSYNTVNLTMYSLKKWMKIDVAEPEISTFLLHTFLSKPGTCMTDQTQPKLVLQVLANIFSSC